MKSLLLASLLSVPARAAGSYPAVGAPAPDFTLNTQEGKPAALKDFRGKWIVLYFYPKDMTRGCTIEAHNFQADLPKYEKKGAVILGVSVQDAQSHQEFCTKESLSFKLLADTGRAVSKAYGSLTSLAGFQFSARNTFLIDPKGVLRRSFIGVSPSKHSAEVLAALDAFQAPGAR